MKKRRVFTIAALLFIAAFVRSFYHLPRSSFDADEEYFALSSQSILSGKLTLIGQQTGIGELYHAPLFNYLVSLLMVIFNGNPLVIKGLGAFFAAITIPMIFLIGRKITSGSAALIASFIALMSHSYSGLESFAPNITPLNLITLIYIYIFIQSKYSRFKRGLVLGALVGLSFHFHILGAMLILPLFFVGLSWIPTFIIFISPLIIFDLRHHFLIISHAWNFFSPSAQLASPFAYRLDTYVTSLADIIAPYKQTGLLVIPTILIALAALWTSRINIWIKITLLLPLFFFGLYSGHLIPYYSIIAWTPFVLFAGYFLSFLYFKNVILRLMIVLYLLVFSLTNLNKWFYQNPPRGINNKIAALEFIKSHSQNERIYLSRTIDLSANFGYDYLSRYVGLELSNNTKDPNYTLVVPAHWQGIQSDMTFGDIGVVLPYDQHTK